MRKRESLCKSFVQSACLAAIVVPPKAILQLLTREATRGKHFFQEARLTPMACYAPSVESRWGLLLSQEWNKAHLINHLAEVHGYRHYLELCTYSSGRRYDEIDRAKFLTCSRLMYRCPDGFDDGLAHRLSQRHSRHWRMPDDNQPGGPQLRHCACRFLA